MMKKNLLKKLTTGMLLTALFSMLLLSGCREQTEETETTPETVTEAETQETESTEEETAETEESTEGTTEETSEETTEAETEADLRMAVLDHYAQLFVVTGAETLNVREAPAADAKIIGAMEAFAGGEVLEMTEDGAWYHIMSGGVDGYVSAEFISTGEEAKQPAIEHAAERLKVNVDAANVRSGADVGSEVIDMGLLGAVYMPVAEEGDFYQIEYFDGQSAYISKSCVEKGWYLAEAFFVAVEEETEDPDVGGGTVQEGTNGLVVCIDAGHQAHGNSEMEPNGPGSTVMKAKLTTGTAGCVTGAAEYQVNLDVSLKLQAELAARGYTVVMVRTTNDCPLSNAERAQVANNAGADVFIRIHCNSLDDSSVTGVINYAPSAANPYLSGDLVSASNTLAAVVAQKMCEATGAQNRGVLQDDGMTGINWCQEPVTIVEMGFMSNPTEDQLLSDPNYQQKLAQGMANGIDAYFGR